MFEGYILTFNPGWDQDGNLLNSYTDVRELQQEFKDPGILPDDEVDNETTGAGSIMLRDPDGN